MKLYSLNFYITKYFFVVVSVQFHKLTKTFTINKTYRPFNSELFCFQINQSDFKEMYAPMLAIILFEVLSSKVICGMLVCFLCNFVMEQNNGYPFQLHGVVTVAAGSILCLPYHHNKLSRISALLCLYGCTQVIQIYRHNTLSTISINIVYIGLFKCNLDLPPQ